MTTPLVPADPKPATEAERNQFSPEHPMMFLFHDDEPRVDGLAIDPAPLPILGTDAARGIP